MRVPGISYGHPFTVASSAVLLSAASLSVAAFSVASSAALIIATSSAALLPVASLSAVATITAAASGMAGAGYSRSAPPQPLLQRLVLIGRYLIIVKDDTCLFVLARGRSGAKATTTTAYRDAASFWDATTAACQAAARP
jgi:hypothetical protein